MPGSVPIHKATIIPRGRALGMVQSLPERDQISQNYEEMIAYITMAMGGRAAEELIYGVNKITSGAAADIQAATKMARAMITQFGFSKDLGMVAYTDPSQDHYMMRNPISEDTQKVIDAEVRDLIQKAYEKAYDNAKASGASDEKAKEIGNIVADKLAEIKNLQRTTDAQQILKLTASASVTGSESSSGSIQNKNNALATTLNPAISQQYTIPPPLATQGPKEVLPDYNNMYANTKTPLQNAATPGISSNANPYMKSTEGMFMGSDSSEPEPANGALGGGFSSW